MVVWNVTEIFIECPLGLRRITCVTLIQENSGETRFQRVGFFFLSYFLGSSFRTRKLKRWALLLLIFFMMVLPCFPVRLALEAKCNQRSNATIKINSFVRTRIKGANIIQRRSSHDSYAIRVLGLRRFRCLHHVRLWPTYLGILCGLRSVVYNTNTFPGYNFF